MNFQDHQRFHRIVMNGVKAIFGIVAVMFVGIISFWVIVGVNAYKFGSSWIDGQDPAVRDDIAQVHQSSDCARDRLDKMREQVGILTKKDLANIKTFCDQEL